MLNTRRKLKYALGQGHMVMERNSGDIQFIEKVNGKYVLSGVRPTTEWDVFETLGDLLWACDIDAEGLKAYPWEILDVEEAAR